MTLLPGEQLPLPLEQPSPPVLSSPAALPVLPQLHDIWLNANILGIYLYTSIPLLALSLITLLKVRFLVV